MWAYYFPAIKVNCPRCGARKGSRCYSKRQIAKTSDSLMRTKPHKERINEALKSLLEI